MTNAYTVNLYLAWDASTGTGVSGYRLYHGSASRTYTPNINIGSQATYTITGQQAPRATCGWNGSCPAAKRVVSGTTYTVLVDAVASLGKGHQPDLPWVGPRSGILSYPL